MIHATAIVSSRAQIGSNVKIGPFCLIHDEVVIGDDCEIQAYCELGVPTALAQGPLVIGSGSLIRSHSVFYQGSIFGSGLRTGHRVSVREKISAGNDLQIGTLSDLQGHAKIGDHVRMHSNVHIGQQSTIADFVWIFPYVVLTNDPHPPSHVCIGPRIDAYAAIATMSVILPGVHVGEGALVAAHSSVTKDVVPHTVVAGSPAKYITETSNIKLKDGSGDSAYPWTRHFHRGYPPDVVERWLKGETDESS
jgi:acetyltransferase-like isoleucine patch superfamily enzyme